MSVVLGVYIVGLILSGIMWALSSLVLTADYYDDQTRNNAVKAWKTVRRLWCVPVWPLVVLMFLTYVLLRLRRAAR